LKLEQKQKWGHKQTGSWGATEPRKATCGGKATTCGRAMNKGCEFGADLGSGALSIWLESYLNIVAICLRGRFVARHRARRLLLVDDERPSWGDQCGERAGKRVWARRGRSLGLAAWGEHLPVQLASGDTKREIKWSFNQI